MFAIFFLFAESETTGVVHRLSLLFLRHTIRLLPCSGPVYRVRPSPKCTYCALPAKISSGIPSSSRITLQALNLGLCSFPPFLSPLSLPIKLYTYRYAHGERESPRYSPCPMPPPPPPHTLLSLHYRHSCCRAAEAKTSAVCSSTEFNGSHPPASKLLTCLHAIIDVCRYHNVHFD